MNVFGYDHWLTTPPEPNPVFCPICGAECEKIFKDKDGEIFGCEECVEECDAWEALNG